MINRQNKGGDPHTPAHPSPPAFASHGARANAFLHGSRKEGVWFFACANAKARGFDLGGLADSDGRCFVAGFFLSPGENVWQI